MTTSPGSNKPPPLPNRTSTQPSDPSTLAPRRKPSAQSLTSPSPSQSHHPSDRRTSTFSLSSIDSLTADLLNPSFLPRGGHDTLPSDEEEVTNWHSTPLLFALLPAVGGVLFKEGAAVVTDLLILGLAGVFLNWSVRLPWDWYFASQRVVSGQQGYGGLQEEAVVVEGEEEAATAEEGAEEEDATRKERGGGRDHMAAVFERREQAAERLRTQETLALLSTFLFPALAAYLLHVLRGQLSQSSTGLVSDYNLSVFLLVAEIRPCRHLIRLIKRRTLHLQRVSTASEEQAFASDKSSTAALMARIEELEIRLDRQVNGEVSNGHATGPAKKSQLDELSLEMKRRYESRIDALERAVRRYEKRTMTLAMVTEQRLKTLDVRLSETLSLAAVAAQQSQQRSAVGRAFDVMVAALMMPMNLAMLLVMWPVKVLDNIYTRLMALLLGTPKGGGKGGRRPGEARTQDRGSVRKADIIR